MTRDADDIPLSEVLFETHTLGNVVKITAVDPATNIEVCVVGSVHTSPYSLQMNAIRKLKAMIRKKAQS